MGSGNMKEEQKKDDQQLTLKVAVAEIEKNNLHRALSIMKQIIKVPSLEAYQKIANLFQDLKLQNKAKQFYQKCLQLAPSNSQILTKLAIIYGQQNEQKKSEQLLVRALESDPIKTILECRNGYLEQALKKMNFALQKINENQHSFRGSGQISDIVLANLYNNIGNTLKYKQKYMEAVQYFQKAIDLNNQNSLFYVNCALTLAHPQIQNYQKAYEFLIKAQNLLINQKSEYNSYVLDKVVNFRQDIEEWNYKKKHNYVTPLEKQELEAKLQGLQKKVKKLFIVELDNSSKFGSYLSGNYDQKLEIIARNWRTNKMNVKAMTEVDGQIFSLFQSKVQNFSIIPFQIVANCIKQLKSNKQILKIEETILNVLSILSQKYPPSTSTAEIKTTIQSFEIPENQKPNLFLNFFFKSYENLVSQILKLPKKASSVFQQFESFAKQICLKRGYNFKAGLKFTPNIDAETEYKIVIRVTQKLFKKQLSQMRKEILESVQKYLNQSQKINIEVTTSSYFKVWKDIITKIIKQRIKNKIQSTCHIYDLARGKCMYRNIENLEATAHDLIAECKKKKYRIIQCDNRLNNNTKDINFKIQIQDVVCQLQLALEFEKKTNQFAHGLYEIVRSPGGCVFGSIIWLGKINQISFIKDLKRLYNEIQHITTDNMELYLKKLDYQFALSQFKSLQ